MSMSLRQYHHETSYQREGMTGHFLDWENQPTVYKPYPGIEPLLLPRDISLPEVNLSSLLKGERPPEEGTRSLDINRLSQILQLTYSLTSKVRHPGGEFYYRSAASAGALYPTEIYVATHDVSGLENGLYHFTIAHHGLSPLRKGNFSQQILRMMMPGKEEVPALTFFLSAIFFRSAWKYRDRSYRYHLLDTGHVIENLILALKSLVLPTIVSYDFNDDAANQFLSFDGTKEVSLAIAHIIGARSPQKEGAQEPVDLSEDCKKASRVAQKEIDYPRVREIHAAGAKVNSVEASGSEMIHDLGVSPETWEEISFSTRWPETRNHSESVLLRRSRRNYVAEPISQDCLTALLNSICTPEFEAAARLSEYASTVGTGFLLGSAEGRTSGFYLVDTSSPKLGIVKPGSLNEKMSRICLDQAWLANAAIHFLFMTNAEALDRRWGARGYRYAMMTAGRIGERLYLVATSLGLGCCGIGAFYDEEAAELLGLNNESRLLYLVAVGPVKTKEQ